MATFVHRKVGGPAGAVLSRRADGVVEMGKLLMRGATDQDVKETGTGTDAAWAISLYDERVAKENDAEQYADNDVMRIETLAPGQVWNLKAEGAITEGDIVCSGADGDVKTLSGTGENIQGLALADVANDARGPILILNLHTKSDNNAGG